MHKDHRSFIYRGCGLSLRSTSTVQVKHEGSRRFHCHLQSGPLPQCMPQCSADHRAWSSVPGRTANHFTKHDAPTSSFTHLEKKKFFLYNIKNKELFLSYCIYLLYCYFVAWWCLFLLGLLAVHGAENIICDLSAYATSPCSNYFKHSGHTITTVGFH